MLSAFITYIIAFAGLAGWVSAVPLNINLGAYSPALVVGDGEISFGGKADVNQLMNALEGAAVNTAANVAQANQNPPAAQTQPAPAVVVPANTENKDKEQANDITGILGGNRKEIEPRVEVAATPEDDEDEEDEEDADGAAPAVVKRDITGFDRALRYAEAALVKGPKVQLGTGSEGSGVGIIVDNNQVAAARPGRGEAEGAEKRPPAAAPVVPAPGAGQIPVAPGGAEKRGLEAPPSRITRRGNLKVTTMYVRSGIPGGKHSGSESVIEAIANNSSATGASLPPASNVVARDLPSILTRRDNSNGAGSSSGFDSVNLNVPSEGVTMTFVETDDDDEA
ncbi:hypothetical protein F5X68DRAFT_145350 [Plectosphaerella plurivora]|uniref:Uncharacterized protein n=1 Tax=Plectosphaerella plurivora TaxID=936078 RepID=A0A9P8V035_9PEZI|nr:hypothetical protein F5X68DRAFT_145350 [Plectosphaerella plurivora]